MRLVELPDSSLHLRAHVLARAALFHKPAVLFAHRDKLGLEPLECIAIFLAVLVERLDMTLELGLMLVSLALDRLIALVDGRLQRLDLFGRHLMFATQAGVQSAADSSSTSRS